MLPWAPSGMCSMVIETSALLLLALLLLTVPINWLLAFFVAAAVHELFHYLALRLLGGQTRGFTIRPGGAVLSVAGLTPGKELLCALAGPLGGLLLLMLYRYFPRVAICAALQSVFNLLPILPLDGGRAWSCVLTLVFGEEAAAKWQRVTEITFCCLLVVACVALKTGIAAVLITILVILRALSRKIPCKLRLPGVQ